MEDPRELRQGGWAPSHYAEPAVGSEQVFVPNSHVRVIEDVDRAEVIRETYRLLAIAVFSAMAVCWFCSRNLEIVRFMASGFGLILAMIGLNAIPAMALSHAEKSSKNAAWVLALDGAFGGLCLSPLVFIAMVKSGLGADAPNLVQAALVITASVFLGISGYVYQSGKEFNAAKGLGVGLAWTLFAAIPLNFMFFKSGVFGLVLAVGVGILGTLQLLWATSSVLRDPEFRSPVRGAFMLWAGLFNLFQAILYLLSSRR
jgi:FtsH-binding integral membrane protein